MTEHTEITEIEAEQKRQAFLKDLQALLEKHDVELLLEDEAPYCQNPSYEIIANFDSCFIPDISLGECISKKTRFMTARRQ